MKIKSTMLPMLLAGALAHLFTGCATVTRGTSEVLVVESEPSGASVRLSNGMVGTTPTSFKIPRKGAVTVTLFKEGFERAEVSVNTQVAGAGAAGMAGNVLVGGIIGVGIDSFSGGMLEHKPNPVRVTMNPVQQSRVVAESAKPPDALPAQQSVPATEAPPLLATARDPESVIDPQP